MEFAEHTVVAMVLNSGYVAKVVLVILLLMSIVCWGIILNKTFSFSKLHKENLEFRNQFEKITNLTQLHTIAMKMENSPLAVVYAAGYIELQKSIKQDDKGKKERVLSGVSYRSIERELQKAATDEVIRLERKVNFLATTGNTAPFIGLFGTVWGVMDAFRIIGVKGSASISGVAPGISEALIATASGLVAAVPAVIAYNTIVNKISRYEKEIDTFIMDFLILVEKNFKVEE